MSSAIKESRLTITNILETGNGFGLTDCGEQCYIPSNVVSASGGKMGDEMNAKLVNNDRDPVGRTPYMAIYLAKNIVGDAELSEEIIALLDDGYLTTKEVAKHIGVNTDIAKNQLNSMFLSNQIVKAKVLHTTQTLFTLWANNESSFL